MAKNIIICCDGTSNQYGKNNTNVVKLYEMIEIGPHQFNFYDPGVGTSSRSLFIPFRWISNKLSQGLGLDLHKNVEDAYLYLMNNFEKEDRIYLFGFSRGAHTVRRLAAVLGKCGLLYRGSDNMVPYVLRMYDGDEDQSIIDNFRKTYTYACPVYLLGVWDTVSALTRLIPRSKLDGLLSSEIQFAYQAVSIDEKRLQFPPNLFSDQNKNANQVIEEVWFAGVHSDVGGSYNEQGLSNIPLKWILNKAKDAGLCVYSDAIESLSLNALEKSHESWRGFFWFIPWHVYGLLILMVLLLVQLIISYADLFGDFPYRPFNTTVYFIESNWLYTLILVILLIPFTQNRRVIPKGSKIHNSVKLRMDKSNYKPNNLLKLIENKEFEWVD